MATGGCVVTGPCVVTEENDPVAGSDVAVLTVPVVGGGSVRCVVSGATSVAVAVIVTGVADVGVAVDAVTSIAGTTKMNKRINKRQRIAQRQFIEC